MSRTSSGVSAQHQFKQQAEWPSTMHMQQQSLPDWSARGQAACASGSTGLYQSQTLRRAAARAQDAASAPAAEVSPFQRGNAFMQLAAIHVLPPQYLSYMA